ncbi:MAG: response regulator [Acidobacteriota bacterium]|nr:response regulator [Acidobacteriota bacterium]
MSLPAPADKRILIASGDLQSRRNLHNTCRSFGYEVTEVSEWTAVTRILKRTHSPSVAIIDWPLALPQGSQPPGLPSQLRTERAGRPLHIILATAPEAKGREIEGSQTEADDYVVKPFEAHELRARIQLGFRLVRLQNALEERVLELETALGRVRNLQGLLPMCSYCKRIRNDRNYWQQVESYIAEHSGAEFTHGVCPHCYETIVKPELEHLRAQ